MPAISLMMAALLILKPSFAFLSSTSTTRSKLTTRLFGAASTSVAVESSVSRLSTLQTLLARHGAPGSRDCNLPDDLMPFDDPPELVSALTGPDEQLANLHPYLYPIAKSKASGSYICAYRNPRVEEAGTPWPIVEAQLGGPGMQVLALNSEHLMRRIVCECDFAGKNQDLLQLYNDGLLLQQDTVATTPPYETGSVQKLGYGVDKYVLLKVGPFADLYQQMAQLHVAKGDEQSALISAEACNGKFAGFGSNFAFYARLLSSLPSGKRSEEARDAARMCLRMPLPTTGLTLPDFKQVAVLGQLAHETDSISVAMEKLKAMYERMREADRDDDKGKTPEQVAIDEANYILDLAVLERKEWSSVREQLGQRLRWAGRDDMANFVDNR
jgi:hypothetical protein